MLREVVPPAPSGDFQDLRAWRLLVVETGCWQSSTGAFLEVTAARLRERVSVQVIHPGDPARDAEVRRWRLAQVGRCAAAADALPGDTVVLDGEMPAALLADEVLEVLGRDVRFAVSGSGAGG
jgi:hypothetical protein